MKRIDGKFSGTLFGCPGTMPMWIGTDKFAFVLNYKVGASTLALSITQHNTGENIENETFDKRWSKIQQLNQFHFWKIPSTNKKQIIAFVRNPIDRFVTLVNWIQSVSYKKYSELKADNHPDYLEKIIKRAWDINQYNDISNSDVHFLSQTRGMQRVFNNSEDLFDENKTKIFDIKEMKNFLESNGIPWKLSNSTSKKYIDRSNLTEEQIKILTEIYEDDFINFQKYYKSLIKI